MTMSQNSITEIKLKLHMVKNMKLDKNKDDKLFKIWPKIFKILNIKKLLYWN